MKHVFVTILWLAAMAGNSLADAPLKPVFNRAPLAEKPYAELPLGAIHPEGWLRDELQRMASGMSGHLDEWYPEVCGPRNGWLGGDGDNWERGPYWIDGLYPLAKLLDDKQLEAKAMRWIDWTIEHQREDGYIGPVEMKPDDRKQPPPIGAQVAGANDWWPRMVMLKILQQHIVATGDQRAILCLSKYFRYQLQTLPSEPLHDPKNPRSGSWWAAQRGGDNLLVVLWLYNVTGDEQLLKLAKLLSEQTVPVTDWFLPGPKNMVQFAGDQDHPFLHGVNLAQMMKTPTVQWQQDRNQLHLDATEAALADIRTFHGQPNGLYGADESLHGRDPSRGSELCSAVEMMYSLEAMLEITGNARHADRLERIAFNALPTQCTADFRARQYFQQTNQVLVGNGARDFFEDGGERQVYGLLTGYPCCTCNLHQGWPKFAQHLWFATIDQGLAALVYAPSSVTAQVAGGQFVTLRQSGGYPFKPTVEIEVTTSQDVEFPLHLRIPGWCRNATIEINGQPIKATLSPASVHSVKRVWQNGDRVTLHTPMPLESSRWFNRSVSIERGPLVFALDVQSQERDVKRPRPDGVPASAMHRGYIEYHPISDWNYGIPENTIRALNQQIEVQVADTVSLNPWTSKSAPVQLTAYGLQLPQWRLDRQSAANPPLSPVEAAPDTELHPIRLIPYGATTLRIAEFPAVSGGPASEKQGDIRISASHVFEHDSLLALHDGRMDGSPRHTFWPHRGTSEWLQYSFDKPRTIRKVIVYWYDDTGRGECRTPESWRLLFRNGDKWQPVRTSDRYATASQEGNIVTFTPIMTSQLRVEVKLRPNFSTGVRELEVD
jgi:DUF1680 family protein